ncbi:hypothetical protein GN958_ATG04515 [Phytophthora infestans]|uniref:Uncharacterized protein n=1 Tax=Phytophthora infestans TaxID=4787 RepID=A0A8S9V2J1_PHYIN|nr:hypothetical protein GN958_ATG04515 [Phytophthora infestans]
MHQVYDQPVHHADSEADGDVHLNGDVQLKVTEDGTETVQVGSDAVESDEHGDVVTESVQHEGSQPSEASKGVSVDTGQAAEGKNVHEAAEGVDIADADAISVAGTCGSEVVGHKLDDSEEQDAMMRS